MAIVEADLDGVVPYLRGGLRARLRLVHGQERRGGKIHGGEGFLLGAFIVAGRAGTMVAEKRKIEVAGMAVRPGDVDTRARFHVHFYGSWLLALIDGCGHEGIEVYSLQLTVYCRDG